MAEHKTRVVIYSRTYRPEPTAAALRLGALTDALISEGADVEVLTSQLSPELQELEEKPVLYSVKRAPVLRDKTGMVRGYIPYMSFDIPGFFRLLTTKRPDAVVCEPPPTSGVVVRLACGIRRIPYVYYAGDIVSDAAAAQGSNPKIVAVVREMERWAFRGASRIITVGKGVVGRISDLSGRQADLVPNGIDTSRGVPTSGHLLPEGFPQVKGPVFLYAGTVADWLAPEIFVDAFPTVREEFPEAALVFLGQGTAWESLQVRAQGIEGIYFVDSLPPAIAHTWYAQADVCLASLLPGSYEYAYPTKILAALAAGTPVIYAGPGDAADDVNNNDLGIVAEVNSVDVAQAMVEMGKRLSEVDERYNPIRLWRWVDKTRSVANSSISAARVVLDVARKK